MFADADHEVIDSPEALFRHLSEEHGLEEARDLDPETAPLQFWLRRHADLERAERAARRQPEPSPGPAAEPAPPPQPRTQASRTQPGARTQPAARAQPEDGREGRRPAKFGDPLVEAVARTLAGRGYDEVAVRSAIRAFADPGGGSTGEAAVRAAFVEPLLRSAAERLLGAGGSRPDTGRPRPDADPREPPAGDPPPEPPRPEAAWAVLWADLGETGRRRGDADRAAGEDGDDLMAVANAVQTRRRVRRPRR